MKMRNESTEKKIVKKRELSYCKHTPYEHNKKISINMSFMRDNLFVCYEECQNYHMKKRSEKKSDCVALHYVLARVSNKYLSSAK